MSIEVLKYAAGQISKYFKMLNKDDYRKTRRKNFEKWHEMISERINKGQVTPQPSGINYSYCASIDPLPSTETLPKGFQFDFYEDWSYAPVKMDRRIAIIKTTKPINWNKPTPEDISSSYKVFRADITTDTINKWHDPDPKIQKLFRSIPKLLKPYTVNTIIVTNKTTYDDILIQLIVLALKDKFMEMDKKTIDIFRSYMRRKIKLTKCNKQFIKDLLYPQEGAYPKSLLTVGTILYHLACHYIRPYNAYTFKFYLTKIIQGLHKEEKRKQEITIPRELKTRQLESLHQDSLPESSPQDSFFESSPQDSFRDRELDDKSHLQENKLTEKNNNFQIFCDERGREIGLGVDRAALELGTSRDKIYRLIRKGVLRVKKIEDVYVLDDKTQTKLREILQKKYSYKNLVSALSSKRNIKPDSARKRIRRKQKK